MRTLVFFVVGLAAACSDPVSQDPQPDADPGPIDPDFRQDRNLVGVSENVYRSMDTFTYAQAFAQFADATQSFHRETMRIGNCRLLEASAEYCQSCSGFCVDDVCQPWPTYRSAGTIAIAGTRTPVSLTYQSDYYSPEPQPLPQDLFDDGAAITMTAAGAEVAGFMASASGVAAIAPALDGACDSEFHVAAGSDATLTWPSPVTGTRVHLRIPSPNNGHGLPATGIIECEGPDVGSITIPAAIVDAMPDLADVDGCSGIACVSIDCPPATLARHSTGTAMAGSEVVEFVVASSVNFVVLD